MSKPKLYALLVGVNEFKGPYTTLRGCVKDVDRVEEYIKTFHSSSDDPPIIVRLTDEQATYEAVKSGFRDHLRAAGPDDIVWFHMSTHGSEEETAPEFKATIEPGGRDQTVICHDSGQGGIPHMADKELAVLLHQATTTTLSGEPKGTPHTIVTLDSCHSGSGTRSINEEELIAPRSAESSGLGRTIESYADGYYASQGDNLNVPSSKHLLISGCRNSEFAGDMSRGGVFTQGLIDALTKVKANISYSDLFLQTRSAVQKMRGNQVPQFQTIDSFNPYTRFLDGSPLGSPDRYEVVEENAKWFVKCGAIHGLPSKPDSNIEIEVLSPAPENKVIGKGTITSVGAQKSEFDIDWNSIGKEIADKATADNNSYQAIIHHFPAEPVFVKVSGQGAANVENVWSEGKSVYLAKGEDHSEDVEIEIFDRGGKYVLKDLKERQEFELTDDLSKTSAEFMIDSVDHVVKWKRMVDLRNENTSSKIPPLVHFRLGIEDSEGNSTTYDGPEIKLMANADNSFDASSQGAGDRLLIFHPEVVVKNAKQNLYFYLFQLQKDYSIMCFEDQKMYEHSRMKDQPEVVLPLWSEQSRGWGLFPGQNESQTHFKLLVTTEELDHNQLQQGPLGAHRAAVVIIQRARISNDWWSCDISVNMARQDQSISSNTEVSVNEGSIKIHAHPNINAKISTVASDSGARSADPAHRFSDLDHEGLEIMSLGGANDMQSSQVLEFDQLHVADKEGLEENPLNISISQAMNEDEDVLPVVFDGTHFRLVGDSEQRNGETLVHVRSFPDSHIATSEDGQVESPFHPEMQDRSLFSTAKMAFFKLKLDKHDNLQQLRAAEIDGDSIKLTDDGLASKVAASKNTLLVVHGILGDCKSIIKNLEKELQRNQDSLKNRYDLILCFDYENLNEKLDSTARIMNDQLGKVGVGSEQNMTVLAHSSGGLVARWYVEQIGGASKVKHLILVGTPNNGSRFGKISEYGGFAKSAIDIGLNFIPDLIPGAGMILKTLKTVSDVTVSMGQMNPSSEFMQSLNSSSDPGIQYSILGGDANAFDEKSKTSGGLLKRLRMKVGDWVNVDDSHDIFSEVASIQNPGAWTDRTPQPNIVPAVACHHFNYFTEEESVAKISELLAVPE